MLRRTPFRDTPALTCVVIVASLRVFFLHNACVVFQGGDLHAVLGAAGTRGVAVHAEVFQQRHGGVSGTRPAGSSGARLPQSHILADHVAVSCRKSESRRRLPSAGVHG